MAMARARDAFLIDANVLVNAVAADEAGESCRALLAAVASGEIEGVCSTAVMEEVWHLELSGRIEGMEGQTARAHALLAPLLPVTDETFAAALRVDAPGRLGANDRIHVSTCVQHGLTAILSSDRGFDEQRAVERLDPLDRGVVARLTGGE